MEASQPLWPSNWPMPAFPFDTLPEIDGLQWLRDIPGLKSAILLRQVHALEHATVSILGGETETTWHDANRHSPHLSGMTTEQGFYLYGSIRRLEIVRAAKAALERLTHGEWQLAIHPRCSTTWPIQLLVQSGLTLGLQALLPKDPWDQLLGIGVAATLATELVPDIAVWWQRYVMTAIPFNLELEEINPVTDAYGSPAHFVRVVWVDHHA